MSEGMCNVNGSQGPSTSAVPGPPEPQLNPFVPHFIDEEVIREPTGTSIVEPDSVLGESGRTYHGYKEGKYLLPNDEAEQDRLDFQHVMITLLFDGKLVLAPLAQAPKRVLDVATGTGIWALEFARSNPASLVIGTDLSKIQPNPNVPNCIFEKDDCEEPWHWGEKFDYIHIRLIVTCISNPQKLIQEAFSHLNPGGWLEIQDACMEFVFEDHENQDSAMKKWSDLCALGASSKGYDLRKAKRYKGWLDNAGFTDVKENRFEIACSPWPTEAKARRIGAYQQKNCLDGLRAMSYMMLRNAGYESHDIEALISDVKQELQERRYKGHTPFYAVYGQKPVIAK